MAQVPIFSGCDSCHCLPGEMHHRDCPRRTPDCPGCGKEQGTPHSDGCVFAVKSSRARAYSMLSMKNLLEVLRDATQAERNVFAMYVYDAVEELRCPRAAKARCTSASVERKNPLTTEWEKVADAVDIQLEDGESGESANEKVRNACAAAARKVWADMEPKPISDEMRRNLAQNCGDDPAPRVCRVAAEDLGAELLEALGAAKQDENVMKLHKVGDPDDWAFKITGNRVEISPSLDLAAVRGLGLTYLRVLREIVNTALYDLEHPKT